MRKILIATCFYLLSQPVVASDWDEEAPGKSTQKASTGQVSPSQKFFLKGQIEHAEKLSPLDESMQTGANFDSKALSQHAKYASNWFQIPSWFAGTFQSNETTIDYQKDYVSGETAHPNHTVASRGQELHGYQQDASGHIWHYYVESGTSKAEQAKQFTFSQIDWYGPEIVEKDRVVMRVLATSLIVDKRTGVIVDSFRREDIKTYEPVSRGQIKVSYTSKSFDSHGLPRDLQNGHSVYQRISSFVPIDSEDGHNYKQLFSDFLKARHH